MDPPLIARLLLDVLTVVALSLAGFSFYLLIGLIAGRRFVDTFGATIAQWLVYVVVCVAVWTINAFKRLVRLAVSGLRLLAHVLPLVVRCVAKVITVGFLTLLVTTAVLVQVLWTLLFCVGRCIELCSTVRYRYGATRASTVMYKVVTSMGSVAVAIPVVDAQGRVTAWRVINLRMGFHAAVSEVSVPSQQPPQVESETKKVPALLNQATAVAAIAQEQECGSALVRWDNTNANSDTDISAANGTSLISSLDGALKGADGSPLV